jgi:tetratricopeptide (TPR) repeat protein
LHYDIRFLKIKEAGMTEDEKTVEELVQQGISAIKEKNRSLGRELLTQASERDPTNVSVWFWLSAAIEDPYQQEKALMQVLSLDPQNTLALKGLQIAQKRIIDSALKQGIEAVQNDDHTLARQLLTEVVERDENNITAWDWLSQVVETSEDQEICLTNILTLDPDNDKVRDKLELLTQTRGMLSEKDWHIDENEPEQSEQRIAPTLAGDILGEEFIQKHTTLIPEPEPEPEPLSVSLWKKYDDELRCPYCGNPTEYKDKRCSTCKNPLWISKHSTEGRSTLLWIVILMQALTTMLLAVVPLVILFVVAQTLGIFNFFSLIPPYLGLSSPLNDEILASAYAIFPKFYFFLAWIPAILGLFYTTALYLRWTPIYYFMLVSALIGLVGSIVGLVSMPSFVGSIFAWGLGILISIAFLVTVFMLESDFRKTRHRLYLEVDSDIKEGMAYMIRGKQYARRGLWALSAIHLRRAIGLLPYEPDGYLATAVACSHLKDYDLARAVLEDGQSQDPDNERLQQALSVLRSEKKTEPSLSPPPTKVEIGSPEDTDATSAHIGVIEQHKPSENDEKKPQDQSTFADDALEQSQLETTASYELDQLIEDPPSFTQTLEQSEDNDAES